MRVFVVILIVSLGACKSHKHTTLVFGYDEPTKIRKISLKHYLKDVKGKYPATQLMKQVKPYQYK